MPSLLFVIGLALLSLLTVSASPTRRQASCATFPGYAPIPVTCPTTPLIRPATSISSAESAYRNARYAKASTALAAWLKKTNSSFDVKRLPAVALTTSGGGYRSLLEGAGVIQAFDSRDSQTGVSGLFQGLTYQAGLSGGSWLLSSFAGNNYPTITTLKKSLWEQAFQDSLLVPANLLVASAYAEVVKDLIAKEVAGFPPTLTDPWGRLLSYQLLDGPDGGVCTQLSDVTSLSNFTSHNVPYPIITSLGVKTFDGECLPGPNATQYEIHPYEFGSWDSGVHAFTPTIYLGTSLSNGKPANSASCVTNYDNLGYILGTSSNLFNEACEPIPPVNTTAASFTALAEDLAALVAQTHTVTARDDYAVYPNPFYASPASPLVSGTPSLTLVDGGEALQNNPIWPFLQPSRCVDAIIVNDNSADTSYNFPNGSEILTTYVQSISAGLTRMPVIPSVETFIAQNLTTHPVFFGCNDPAKITIVWIPNVAFTYASNQSTSKLEYTVAETDAMIANGVAIGTNNGDTQWPTCLACGLVKKMGTSLPGACTACFTKYCYN